MGHENLQFQLWRRRMVFKAVLQFWLLGFLAVSGFAVVLVIPGVWQLGGVVMLLAAVLMAYYNRDLALVIRSIERLDAKPEAKETGVLNIELEIDYRKMPKRVLGNVVIKPVNRNPLSSSEQPACKVTWYEPGRG